MIEIGEFQILSIETGTFRLDGGAMFGVVPKTLWAPHEDVDEQNRILLATRTLVAVSRDRKHVILVDTGTGTKWSGKEASRFAVAYDGEAIGRALSSHFGLTADDVTDIIVTHLHFDHNGGLTVWSGEPGGDTCLRFPGARLWLHRRQWDHVQLPSEKDRASFLKRDYDILEACAEMSFVDGAEPVAPWPGLRFFASDGHTPGQLLPIFSDGERSLMFTGDVFPTSSHLRPAWVMAYDLEPLKTIAEKKHILGWCRGNGLTLAFPHDHRLGGAVIDFANGKPFVAHPLDI